MFFLSPRRDDAGCSCCRFDSFDGGCTGFIIGGQDSFDSLARLHAGNFWFLAAGGSHWSYRRFKGVGDHRSDGCSFG